MGQGILDKIQARFELWRLEQRYTRRRHRRSTFVSNAIYVDGEYIYQTPNSTGTSADSQESRIDALHGEKPVIRTSTMPTPLDAPPTGMATADRKRLHRFSSIPGFGGSFKDNKDLPIIRERRTSMIR